MSFSPLEFVEKLSFVRYGGTPEERRAAELIRSGIEAAGGSAEFQEFRIPASACTHCAVSVTEPFARKLDVTPYGMCASVPAPGRDLKFRYVEQGTQRDLLGLSDLSDSIVLVNALSRDAFRLLCERHAAAILVITGKYYHTAEEAGIYGRNLRPKFLEFGDTPTFGITAHDAAELVRDGAAVLHVELTEENGDTASQNVEAVIPGTENGGEEIILTAHYDSVPIGTGSWDNATGSAALFGLYLHFLAHPARRTLRFLWCGAEEQGLLGSKAYVEQHADTLDALKFCFNFDMCGTILGSNHIFVTGGKELETFVDQYCRETGYSADIRTQVHSSDSAPFADHGIPAIGLSRGTPSAEIHTGRDLLFPIGEAALLKNIVDFGGMVERVANAAVLPVDVGMPEEMKKELDRYFQRETK